MDTESWLLPSVRLSAPMSPAVPPASLILGMCNTSHRARSWISFSCSQMYLHQGRCVAACPANTVATESGPRQCRERIICTGSVDTTTGAACKCPQPSCGSCATTAQGVTCLACTKYQLLNPLTGTCVAKCPEGYRGTPYTLGANGRVCEPLPPTGLSWRLGGGWPRGCP